MSIEVESLSKSFGDISVLRSITETFAQEQISVLLGASGCGKTTTLRCIAGLEHPSAGRITIDGRVVYQDRPPASVPVERRRIAMVFQSYAIWPHMTVFQNVSLPLRADGIGKSEITSRVTEVLNLVGLGDLGARSATQLSGGQQQRVALARCIVSEAPVILMDEPLSNLDAKLRISMRTEISDLQRRLKRTVLFVTHDQEEAMSIADTIYLFNDGQIIQKGSPKDLYENPKSRYAAEFLGRANIIVNSERATDPAGSSVTRIGGITIPLPDDLPSASALCIRPEKWRAVSPESRCALTGRITKVQYIGDRTEIWVDTPAGVMMVVEISSLDRRPNDLVGLQVEPRDVKFLPA